MKKTIILFALCCFTLFLSYSITSAQSMKFTHADTVVSGSPEDSDVMSEISVQSLANAVKKVIMEVKVVSLTPGHAFIFCDFNNCYGGATGFKADQKGSEYNLPAGVQKGGLSVHIIPNGTKGESILKGCFYVIADPTDRIEYLAVFKIGTTGVEENKQLVEILPSPNPANDFVSIAYKLNSPDGTIKIYNENTTLVKTINISNNSENTIVNTSDLTPGKYFFMISSGDKVITAKSFSVVR